MNELHLFAGAGGGMLGSLLLGHRIIGAVEIDEYCQKVIAQRQKDWHLGYFPIFGDIRAFINSGCAEIYRGITDIICAGFPCQPFSVAGKRKGAGDSRNMWPETIETIRIIRPKYAFLENVPGLLGASNSNASEWDLDIDPTDNIRYFGTILSDLAEAGYDAKWCVLGADDVGAPHRRKRLWVLAYSKLRSGKGADVADAEGKQVDRIGSRGFQPFAAQCCTWWDEDPADVEVTEQYGLEKQGNRRLQEGKTNSTSDSGSRPTQSRLGRVAHGVAHRVDRLKAIGNGQVPIVAATAWRILS
jgi:DNA (cytosine-5)-methyltransferase 1